MTDEKHPQPDQPEIPESPEAGNPEAEIQDPIGDETEAEAHQDSADDDESEPEFKPKQRPPAKLERLQKILAQAGVASRRKAEEMIEQGRVQVNGKVVTELGTKADAGRDHVRVDGKLLQGAERLRYFVLNKPRGFVTTVKDPEGRPTVMQFFDKMRERLYPVGRLDYMSEGLLLVTNDGEMANKLTRASAGVEKTYLVKVAGIPSESELDILRAGVAIEKGKPGSSKVRTSPARIRQVRQGDNPWYEVVLIEGRNRELRKMFEEVGHFVEKIRRVGYGPLILDQEPGNLRELDPQELELLRKAADGKLKTPKAKEIRRRNIVDSLPPEKPAFKTRGAKPAAGPKDYKPKKAFSIDKPARSSPARFGEAPRKFGAVPPTTGPDARPAWKKDDQSGTTGRPPARFAPGPSRDKRPAAGKSYGARPAAGRSFGAKPASGSAFGAKPAGRTFGPKPVTGISDRGRPTTGQNFPPKPAWKKPEAKEWPPYKRPPAGRPEATRRPAPEPPEELGPRKPSQLRIEPIQDTGRSDTGRSRSEQTRSSRPSSERPGSSRPSFDRPRSSAPSGRSGSAPFAPVRTGASGPGSPRFGSSGAGTRGPGTGGFGTGGSRSGRTGAGQSSGRSSSTARPFRSEGGLARPFTTSSGKPRAGGARPSSKPGNRSFGPPSGRSRPRTGGEAGRSQGGEGFAPRGESSRPERRGGTGWKPKPKFGGENKGRSAGASKPKAGGFSKSGFKGKPSGSGPKRTGSKPGGFKPGGKRPGGAGGRRP